MAQDKSANEQISSLLAQPLIVLQRIFSNLNILELCVAGATCTSLKQVSESPKFWEQMLLSPSSHDASNVKNAINNHNYIKLTPQCLLQLFPLGKINIQAFKPDIIKLLEANENDPISQKVLALISPEMIRIYKGSGLSPRDFTELDLEQLYSLFLLRHTPEIFSQTDIKPSDFIPLTPAQIKAIALWDEFARELFIEHNFNPKDFVDLSVLQLDTIALNNGCKQLFTACRFKPRELAPFSPMHLEILIQYPDADKVVHFYNLNTSILASFSLRDLELLVLTQKMEELNSHSSPFLFDDINKYPDVLNLTDIDDEVDIGGDENHAQNN